MGKKNYFLPTNIIMFNQLMDQGVIESMKRRCRKWFVQQQMNSMSKFLETGKMFFSEKFPFSHLTDFLIVRQDSVPWMMVNWHYSTFCWTLSGCQYIWWYYKEYNIKAIRKVRQISNKGRLSSNNSSNSDLVATETWNKRNLVGLNLSDEFSLYLRSPSEADMCHVLAIILE